MLTAWAAYTGRHALLILGCSLSSFLLGWGLAERSVIHRHLGALHRIGRRLIRHKATRPSRCRTDSTKAGIKRLRELARAGGSLKHYHIRTWGFFAAMATADWQETVHDEVKAICGEKSVEYALVRGVSKAPGAWAAAMERTQEPGLEDTISLLLGDRSTLGSFLTGSFGGLARMPDAFRDFEIACMLDAIRTVILRLQLGYGPVETPDLGDKHAGSLGSDAVLNVNPPSR